MCIHMCVHFPMCARMCTYIYNNEDIMSMNVGEKLYPRYCGSLHRPRNALEAVDAAGSYRRVQPALLLR